LDRQTKELIYVAVLTALSAPRAQVIAHMHAALAAGVAPSQLLEVLEQILPPVGVPRFIEGLDAWSETLSADASISTAPSGSTTTPASPSTSEGAGG